MIRKLGRPMLASVYIADGADTVLNTSDRVEETEVIIRRIRTILPRKYHKNLPSDAELTTRVVGVSKIGAGSLLALGKAPRTSAAVLAVLSAPTILARNAFWETQDREEKITRKQGFLTSVALLGGLAITSVDTAGKPGLKWRANKAAQKANKQLQQALPTKSKTEKFADSASASAAAFAHSAKDWFGEASDKVTDYTAQAQDYINENKNEWLAFAENSAAGARSTLADAADQVQGFFNDLDTDKWLDQAQDNAKIARKKVVKVAEKAQAQAKKAAFDAEKKTGRASRRASKKATKLQKRADKLVQRAQKKLGDLC
ncbi:DoxX family protein [Corynebacterium kutscheri]|uniref:DoxX family protein n=1 Tax=Corynebacterium kutscheri TaxID=35755 RepID=UPI0037BF3035